ncbi:hypothetical protein ABC304_09340 [Microbacterium sp. 1P10UB]|uniref:hypothetical protein n=1 Tax=unclassified Microbacterium TaxID=2609290 RepID=UPI0039A03C0D
MASADSLIPLPSAAETETRFVARSGAIVTLRLMDSDLWEVKLDTRGDYTATLHRSADGTFELRPVRGVHAVGQTGVTDQELYDRF